MYQKYFLKLTTYPENLLGVSYVYLIVLKNLNVSCSSYLNRKKKVDDSICTKVFGRLSKLFSDKLKRTML